MHAHFYDTRLSKMAKTVEYGAYDWHLMPAGTDSIHLQCSCKSIYKFDFFEQSTVCIIVVMSFDLNIMHSVRQPLCPDDTDAILTTNIESDGHALVS